MVEVLVGTAESKRFECPYCERKSASPGGVRFHVKLAHPEKLDEFDSKHYAAMEELFIKHFPK
ncbi:unnamed protein product [marine sediment metagenome]|uniref:C2H2-type domain-containing protein n=1 Tax=marine sediment metagenome TaxID=412755 RepID=X1D1Q9_9ZZZZ